jgi:hypothetical protein
MSYKIIIIIVNFLRVKMSEIGLIFIPDQTLLFKVKSKGVLPVPCGDRLPRILGIVSVSGLQLVARVASNGTMDSISARDKFTWLTDEDYWGIVGNHKSIVKALLNDIYQHIQARPPQFDCYPHNGQPFVIANTDNPDLIRYIERDLNKKPKPQPEPAKLSSLFMRSLVR